MDKTKIRMWLKCPFLISVHQANWGNSNQDMLEKPQEFLVLSAKADLQSKVTFKAQLQRKAH